MSNSANDKRKMVAVFQQAKELYLILSDATRLPFVECNADTYDDEVLVFEQEEAAKKAAEALREEGNPVRVGKISKEQRLAFFSGLFSLGVNAVLLNKGTAQEYLQELDKIVRRPDIPRLTPELRERLKEEKNLKFSLENPEFQLTAIYLTQKSKNKNAGKYVEEIEDLREEMMIHYQEGYYLTGRTEDGKVPLLKGQGDQLLQPVFTDMQEFLKFQKTSKDTKLRTIVVTEQEILKNLSKEAVGIVVNPFGIGLVLKVNRKTVSE